MDKKMEAKEVGNYDSLPGTFEGIPYNLFIMKDSSGYTMKIQFKFNSMIRITL
jgi:hypothetical protein